MTLEELEAIVAKMRALGVVRFGDIELGPPPPPPLSEPEREPSEDERVTRSLDRMLRSSGVTASESFIERWKRATVREDV
jgi:hypothetical protein